ncbi:Protein FecR [compost metagenome]
MSTRPDPRKPDAVAQAAGWLVRLERDDSAATREAWQRWYAADPSHAAVWQRFALLQEAVPASGAAAAALGAIDFQHGRRRALKLLVAGAGIGLGGPLLYGRAQEAGWLAAYRSATGEQRSLALNDDVVLMMNTDTALDVARDGRRLDIALRDGEIMLDTRAADPAVRILTRGGCIVPARARLVVRAQGPQTRVALEAGQAAITTRGDLNQELRAGDVRRFSAHQIAEVAGWAGREFAWVQGMLIADDMPLDAFLAELARYRPGLIQCDDRAAALRVNGSFRLKDTDQVLEALAAALSLRIRYRTRYWVRVESA